MTAALLVLGGYVAGSIPSGYWLLRLTRGEDVRTVGSGNIGASNVWRSFGPRYGVPVALLDIAKGFVPAFVATLVAGDLVGVLAGGAAMLGHWRPLFLGFRRGGKMVATLGGALLGVAPAVFGLGAVIWLLIFAACRYASVASIGASVALPALAFALGEPWPVIAFSAVAAIGIVALHRPNIARLRAGQETRFTLRRTRPVGAR